MKFELCTDCVEGAEIADNYGFDSIELCAALSVGGLTPNFGLIQQCVEQSEVAIHVMIRHREGGFQLVNSDLSIMQKDIEMVRNAGAHGVVFGLLDKDKRVAEENEELVTLAKSLGLKTTFHRAFDFVPDFREAAQKVVDFGFDRLLTSGLRSTAEKGISVIAELQQTYGQQLQVLAGSGVAVTNALKFSGAGIQYLHFTARKPENTSLGLGMGQRYVSDVEKIQRIINLPYNHIN